MSRIFKDQADIPILHDPEDKLTKRGVPLQKPDRIFGLQVTKIFRNLLSKLPGHRHSPTHDPILLYPFLILEAKSEKHGHGFGSIERQTAFPIRTLLKIQRTLQTNSGADSYLSPLVWFLGNQGDEWRVYGCVVSESDYVRHFFIQILEYELKLIYLVCYGPVARLHTKRRSCATASFGHRLHMRLGS